MSQLRRNLLSTLPPELIAFGTIKSIDIRQNAFVDLPEVRTLHDDVTVKLNTSKAPSDVRPFASHRAVIMQALCTRAHNAHIHARTHTHKVQGSHLKGTDIEGQCDQFSGHSRASTHKECGGDQHYFYGRECCCTSFKSLYAQQMRWIIYLKCLAFVGQCDWMLALLPFAHVMLLKRFLVRIIVRFQSFWVWIFVRLWFL